MFKTGRDFQAALRVILARASENNPSRSVLADDLEALAEGVIGAPRRKPVPKEAPPIPPKEIANAGKLEAEGLAKLKQYIGMASDNCAKYEKRVVAESEDKFNDAVRGEFPDVDAAIITKMWQVGGPQIAFPDMDMVEDIFSFLMRGVEACGGSFEKAAEVTGETDLAAVITGMSAEIDSGTEYHGEPGTLMKVKAIFDKAEAACPTAITGPGSLAQLQKCVDLIMEGCTVLWGQTFNAPKIPKALEPEDPRQQGFSFSASIKSPSELQARLNAILGNTARISRPALAAQILKIARDLTGATSTPTFDKAVEDQEKIEGVLETSGKRLLGFADKAEQAISERQYKKAVAFCGRAMTEVQKIFDLFRPLLSAKSEVQDLGVVGKSARELLDAVRELDAAYKLNIRVNQSKDEDSDAAKKALDALDALVRATGYLKTFFRQFVESSYPNHLHQQRGR